MPKPHLCNIMYGSKVQCISFSDMVIKCFIVHYRQLPHSFCNPENFDCIILIADFFLNNPAPCGCFYVIDRSEFEVPYIHHTKEKQELTSHNAAIIKVLTHLVIVFACTCLLKHKNNVEIIVCVKVLLYSI